MPLLPIAIATLPRPAENLLGQIVGLVGPSYDPQQIPTDGGSVLADPLGHTLRFR